MPLKEKTEKAGTEFDAKRAFEHVKNLASFGSRLAGTEGDTKSIKYMSEQFAKAGLKVEYDVFNAPSFIEKEAKVLLSYPSKKEIKVRAMLYSVQTSREGVKGELVYANLCRKEDFAKINAKGKIVMFSRTRDKDAFWEEVTNAAKNGAKGVIMVDYNPWIFTATMESGYFNIQKRFLSVEPNPIPAVTMTSNDGQFLLEQSTKGKVEATLIVDVKNEEKETKNVRATIEGEKKADEKILVIAHRDTANTPGANDNASGLATLIELARILPNYHLDRSVELMAVGAEEELGSLGSYNYCKMHKNELEKIRAVINVDMVAVGSKLKVITEGLWPDKGKLETSKEINKLLVEEADKLGYFAEYGICSFATSDEGRFIDAGVPASWLWKPDDPYYHSMEDTPDKVNPNDIKAVCEIVKNTVIKLAKA
ncbi:M28 family peptidase [Candidatus Bathyarchaeota archaeon]|nr:M28 family peptidase [Candidatus Bathyarchaeota archaeon]